MRKRCDSRLIGIGGGSGRWIARLLLISGIVAAVAAPTMATMLPVTATGRGPHCFNTSTLDPSPAMWMNQCDWLDDAISKSPFTQEAGWTFRYADADGKDFALSTGALQITNYFAWVVNEPEVTADDPAHTKYGGRYKNVDRGGAVFGLKYTPDPAKGDPASIHWIQVVDALYGSDRSRSLDPRGQTGDPWYDTVGAAGNTWFLDIPSTPCKTCPCGGGTDKCNYSSNVDFQVFVAVDNVQPDGKHVVDLYEGYWWGYEYACTPEPAAMLLVVLGFAVLFAGRQSGRLSASARKT